MTVRMPVFQSPILLLVCLCRKSQQEQVRCTWSLGLLMPWATTQGVSLFSAICRWWSCFWLGNSQFLSLFERRTEKGPWSTVIVVHFGGEIVHACIIIIMESCKAPTLRLKVLNKHTHIMYIEMENVIKKINKGFKHNYAKDAHTHTHIPVSYTHLTLPTSSTV